MPSKHEERVCRVIDCGRPISRKGRLLCFGHEKRRARLGNECARVCHGTRHIVVDIHAESHILDNPKDNHVWTCTTCLLASEMEETDVD